PYVLLYSLRSAPCSRASYLSTAPAPSTTSTLSLHDALPISSSGSPSVQRPSPARHDIISSNARNPTLRVRPRLSGHLLARGALEDRKSTRLNSSHEWISYAVFCLKKKKKYKNLYKL